MTQSENIYVYVECITP